MVIFRSITAKIVVLRPDCVFYPNLVGGRVALGGFPPRAPTDPYVDTLDHTVPQVTPSLRQRHYAAANPSFAIRWRYGDTTREFNASHVFPANGVVTRCLASHPPGPRGSSSPASSVLSRHCDFLPPIPPRFVSFTWRYHGITHRFAPAAAAWGNVGPGVGHPVSPSGNSSVETTGSPKFLGNPDSRLHMFSDPAGRCVPDHLRNARVAPAK